MLCVMYAVVAQHWPVSNPGPQLNSVLDRAALAAEFRQRGRIQIRDVLTKSSADRLYLCLQREISYALYTNIGGMARALRDLSPEERHTCIVAAWREVGTREFKFAYDTHLVSFAGEPYSDSRHYLAQTAAFLNGPEFLAFAREVTGIGAIEFADAQATRYGSGHFLTAHNDNVAGSNRLVAYVLGFTPTWRPEWGGLLEFLDGNGEIETGYLPGFNTLKLFSVPMSHHVSMVAPYAQGLRHSITGWLRAR
jgi:Rps23 Pro-64 3,4-dihydroxylase Tpa1-like proline 4-hydroxylase